MERRERCVGTRIIRILEIARVTTGAGRVPGRHTLIASQLNNSISPDRQLHDVIQVRWVFEVAVEPPFVEGHVR
jgi:hypothetical protein